MFLSGVDVRTAPRVLGTLVAFGDSITDGYLSTNDAKHRYPDDLANSLAKRKSATLGVVNAGIIPVYEQLILQAHEAGLKIYGATLTPFGGSNAIYGGDYGTPADEQQRQLVNAWIRTSGAFDRVIDFDKAVRDPANPTQLLPAYVGDPLHPNDAGYQAMANAVNLDAILDDIDN
jgi:lysophospholipase L1-like esterase